MCQLTIGHTGRKGWNLEIGMILARNGGEKNDDGTGLMARGINWKTQLAAHNITNLGSILRGFYERLEDTDPVAFHVRSATTGIPVTVENAHPFEGKYFTLMHNGTLHHITDDDYADNYEGWYTRRGGQPTVEKDSDSERFLKALEEVKEKNQDAALPQLLEMAMKDFYGKFAFIIKDNVTNTMYVVRGKTADLYWSDVYILSKKEVKELEQDKKELPKRSPDGFVVNTSKEVIIKSLLDAKNLIEFRENVSLAFSTPALLLQETLFEIKGKELIEIGKIKENYAPAKPAVAKKPEVAIANNTVTNRVSNVGLANAIKLSDRVATWLMLNSLDISDLQRIVAKVYGISLLEMTEKDAESFLDDCVVKLNPEKKLAEKVREALQGQPFPIQLYKKHGLIYPWTLNHKKDILKVLEDIKK